MKLIKENLDKISLYTMYFGIIIGIYGFYKIYVSRKDLPIGACPIENNSNIMHISIIILIISIIISFIYDFLNKENT